MELALNHVVELTLLNFPNINKDNEQICYKNPTPHYFYYTFKGISVKYNYNPPPMVSPPYCGGAPETLRSMPAVA
jgi:hypothetical protein